MRKHGKRRLVRWIIPAGLAGAVAVAAVAIGAPPTQTFTGSIKPTKLPKKGYAPVKAKFNLDITSSDTNPPPPMLTATAIFDNQVKVENRGLPVCRESELENTDEVAARKACKKAIIGKGFANAKVTFPAQAPIDAPAPVTMFNGGNSGGGKKIIIHAYTTVPAPTTFIVPGILRKGGGGQTITFQVPPIAGGYGTLVHFDAKLGKKYKIKKKGKTLKLSYANAKCKKGKITLEGDFTYQDGTASHTDFSAKCKGKNKKK